MEVSRITVFGNTKALTHAIHNKHFIWLNQSYKQSHLCAYLLVFIIAIVAGHHTTRDFGIHTNLVVGLVSLSPHRTEYGSLKSQIHLL